MKIEQLLSPASLEWFHKKNIEVNEGKKLSTNDIISEFEDWFKDNKDIINNSIIKESGTIDDIDDDIDDVKDETPDTSIDDETDNIDVDVPDTHADSSDIDDEYVKPEEGVVDVEELGTDMSSSTKIEMSGTIDDMSETIEGGDDDEIKPYSVNNSKNSTHNIYNFVNTWYDLALSNGTNKDVVTPLYYLDTTDCDNMTALFAFANIPDVDLSSWNTSNVRHMEGMFYKSTFANNTIKDWDVSSCINFKNMFYGSKFDGDISKWEPGTVARNRLDDKGKPVYDSSGEVIVDDVPVDLPFVGARVDHDALAKAKIVSDVCKSYDSEIEKEKIKRDKKGEVSESNLKNIMSFDNFIKEGFGDFIKRGAEKIKKMFKLVSVKFNDYYLAFFNKSGEMLPVTSPYTTLNYISNNNVNGVQLSIPGEQSNINITESGEYYDFMKPGTREFENYKTFVRMINESYEKHGDELFEKIMPLTSQGSGVGVDDITSKDFKNILRRLVNNAPAYKERGGKAVIIFGAPGIGKSTIPKEIIKEVNGNKTEGLKSVMVVNCGDLTLDGFYLPIPKYKKLSELEDSHPKLHELIVSSGVDIEKFKNNKVQQTIEAPKSWLPCYIKSTNTEENELMNAIANGHMVTSRVYDEKKGKYIEINKEATEGGIILFDELFRADPEIFKILMQIILERETQGGMRIGDKWSILCCSNRPNDDNEVKLSRDASSPVLGNRFLGGAYNFIPDFEDWRMWAKDIKGILDDYTTMFLTSDPSSDESTERNVYDIEYRNGETDEDEIIKGYHRWHNVDPDLYKSSNDNSVFMFPTPRTWTALLEWIADAKEEYGVKSILNLPMGELRKQARGVIGVKTADDYVDFLKSIKSSGLSIASIFKKDDYTVDPEVCDVTTSVGLIMSFVRNRWNNKDKFPKPAEEEMLINMYNFLFNSYTANGVGGSFITTLHSNIIRNVLNISSKSTKKIERLKRYIDLVKKEYNVKFADEAI